MFAVLRQPSCSRIPCLWRSFETVRDLLRRDVLILGSFPGPLALFSSRAVDEKFAVDAGVFAAHCVAGVRNMEAAALNGLKTGRKEERFMVE